MRIRLSDYKGEFKVFSLAISPEAETDLINEDVICWRVHSDQIVLQPTGDIISTDIEAISQFRLCNDYDVWTVSESGVADRCYDASSVENCFFITEKCNSNCVMCPSPEVFRKRGNSSSIEDLISVAEHIPEDAPHITITGGEPFMVGKELFKLLGFCQRKFRKTEFQILTNGRIFSIQEYCDLLIQTIPEHTLLAIPIHGSTAYRHDAITQVRGSFDQTLRGLKNLHRLGVATEIRIVVNKLNSDDLKLMAKMIINELKQVMQVCIIAMEMTGSAYTNRSMIWLPYREAFYCAKEAIDLLIQAGINVKLYNFPLCTVNKRYWMLCHKSISSWKVRYIDQCDECTIHNYCGGVFSGTLPLVREELEAIH